MAQPTTSRTTEGDQQIEAENIGPTTTKMIKRMIWKNKLDQISTTKSIPLSDPVARTAMYTGMNRINVEKILAFGETLKYELEKIDRNIIHKQLIHMYTVQNHIPTITELFISLQEKLPIYVDFDYFTKILIKMGYVFYKFPRRKALRVMEKKSVTFERHRFLKNIIQYQNNDVPIVYVGLLSFNRNMDIFNLEQTLQKDTENIISHIFFTASIDAIENIKVIPAATFEVLRTAVKDWLLEIFLLKKLPEGTVCVLEDSKIFNQTLIKVPTWKSVKADMVEWLEQHNIPCHIDMPKADLLQLIETCTDTNKNTYVLDNLIKAHNYSILRLPQCINGLSIVALIVRYLNDEQNVTNLDTPINPNEMLNNLTSTHLKNFLNTVQIEEKRLLHEDNEIDNTIDKLISYMKTLEIDAEDKDDDTTLPFFSDSE